MMFCVLEGATAWQQASPNRVLVIVFDPLDDAVGVSKLGWLNALNISARN